MYIGFPIKKDGNWGMQTELRFNDGRAIEVSYEELSQFLNMFASNNDAKLKECERGYHAYRQECLEKSDIIERVIEERDDLQNQIVDLKKENAQLLRIAKEECALRSADHSKDAHSSLFMPNDSVIKPEEYRRQENKQEPPELSTIVKELERLIKRNKELSHEKAAQKHANAFLLKKIEALEKDVQNCIPESNLKYISQLQSALKDRKKRTTQLRKDLFAKEGKINRLEELIEEIYSHTSDHVLHDNHQNAMIWHINSKIQELAKYK